MISVTSRARNLVISVPPGAQDGCPVAAPRPTVGAPGSEDGEHRDDGEPQDDAADDLLVVGFHDLLRPYPR